MTKVRKTQHRRGKFQCVSLVPDMTLIRWSVRFCEVPFKLDLLEVLRAITYSRETKKCVPTQWRRSFFTLHLPYGCLFIGAPATFYCPSHPIPPHPIPSHPIPSHPIPPLPTPLHPTPPHPTPFHPLPQIHSFVLSAVHRQCLR